MNPHKSFLVPMGVGDSLSYIDAINSLSLLFFSIVSI